MPSYSVNRLEYLYGDLRDKNILVIGVSYKPNISDTRESAAEPIMGILRKRGAHVSWHDPLVSNYDNGVSSPISGKYDLGLVLVQHNSLDLSEWNGNPIYCVNTSDSHPDWIPILANGNLNR
jgi:UDP-N-acetyl-D-glucosamine dehydrogenase